ncbi:MAG TPA: ADP-ribosylglycohydrolase family protein [Phycisphaerales bacterium]|nr:ADP-ribosylglycohydrolase family protein [Phycisphaerales bacterium]
MSSVRERAVLCLMGTAVGDALGLAREGLSARRGARMFPGEPRPQLLPGMGMVSDDTEHACMAAQAFIESGGEVRAFRRALARRMRWWFASIPPEIGLATVRSCLKLWAGVSPERSGVRSAGNGPLMRAPILGVLGRDAAHVRELVEASTRMTHTDEHAVEGALMAGAVAHALSRGRGGEVLEVARSVRIGGGTESYAGVEAAMTADVSREDERAFARRVCGARGAWGVSGYVVHTLACSLYAWRRHRASARDGMGAIVLCGGDTDSTGALVGGLYGADGTEMPGEWVSRVREWPRSVGWVRRVGGVAGEVSAGGGARRAPGVPMGAGLVRNVGLTAVVIGHVVRRGLPPY